MIIFLYILISVLTMLLISFVFPGFSDNMNISFYLIITALFAFSSFVMLLRKKVKLFRSLSVYIAIFLTLFIIAEGALIYYSADTVPTGNEQAIIVTGSGLFVESRMTVELQQRIDKAIEIYGENPHLPIVLSGGTDENRALPECVAMKSYLEKQIFALGIDMPVVITEDSSSSIKENISLSFEKSAVDSAFIIVSHHNVPATKLITSKLHPGSTIIGAGYPISKYPIYYIREIGYALRTFLDIGIN